MEHILDGPLGPIRPQDYKNVISSISTTTLGIIVLCEFLENNFTRILNEIPEGESLITYTYSILASKVSLDEEINMVSFISY